MTNRQSSVQPSPMEVAERVWAIRLPLPVATPAHVVAYVVLGSEGIAVIDGGDGADRAWEVFRAGMRDIGVPVSDVTHFVSTHFHPDHYAFASRISDAAPGSRTHLHRDDVPGQAVPNVGAVERRDLASRWGTARTTMYDEAIAAVRAMTPAGPPDVALNGGEWLDLGDRRLHVVATPGHTAGHVCLHEPLSRVVFTGDHVLPDIHPGLASPSGVMANPLRSYLDSLEIVVDIDADIALPAHGTPFGHLAERARTHRDHHETRLRDLLALVTTHPQLTAFELAERRNRSLDWNALPPLMRWGAYGKTWSALVELAERGHVNSTPDAVPVWHAASMN